ncbi:MAG: VWA domain-containing protein, partial [Chloroflexi bacterium CFX6]|nr:VWA domain-containing protein [Chloroflexi bacterium CFX6]
PAAQPAVVVLTDGRSNPRPAAEAVERAAAAKARGVAVFTVGLGDDVDAEALAAMASRPAFAFHTADAEALAGIYRAIAVAIPCPPGTFWGQRQRRDAGGRGGWQILGAPASSRQDAGAPRKPFDQTFCHALSHQPLAIGVRAGKGRGVGCTGDSAPNRRGDVRPARAERAERVGLPADAGI